MGEPIPEMLIVVLVGGQRLGTHDEWNRFVGKWIDGGIIGLKDEDGADFAAIHSDKILFLTY